MIIKSVKAKKIKDSRREETIQIRVNGLAASSPSGKSKGKHETPSYYKNIDFCVNFVNNLKIDFAVNSFADLAKVEKLICEKLKFRDARKLGANVLFALESAILKALAKEKRKQLWQIINRSAKKFPVPVGNAIGGGLHSLNKRKPDFQEFLIIPREKSFAKNVAVMKNIYRIIGKITNGNELNDEGAWQIDAGNEQILEILHKFKGIDIGIDAAASSFYKNGAYDYGNKKLDRNEQIRYINDLIKVYGIFYVEDPLNEEDFSGFKMIEKKYLVVGDDLTASQIERLKKAKKAVNTVIIKPNQNGSLIKLKELFEFCRKNGIKTVMSHRSGETMDDALADYAFAFQADYFKAGIATKWREAKLKRMIKIENSI